MFFGQNSMKFESITHIHSVIWREMETERWKVKYLKWFPLKLHTSRLVFFVILHDWVFVVCRAVAIMFPCVFYLPHILCLLTLPIAPLYAQPNISRARLLHSNWKTSLFNYSPPSSTVQIEWSMLPYCTVYSKSCAISIDDSIMDIDRSL